jgi:hypothetical protein
MVLQVIVMVSTRVARALQAREPQVAEALQLQRITEMTGAALEPLHPGSQDPELARYFQIDVPDAEMAQRVTELLRQSPLVDAAYMKPPDEKP